MSPHTTTHRASWKGSLRIAELVCPVALHAAASTSDRIALHRVNKATGNRIRREFADAETGKPVPSEDQVRGYDLPGGDAVLLTPEDIASAIPDSDKVLSVTAFVPCDGVDDVYFDKPYYLVPSNPPGNPTGTEAFALIRDGLRQSKVAAIARTVLFRRMRTVLIRAQGAGLAAVTLNFDYEIRPATDAFKDLPDVTITAEMLDLARHIIQTKAGHFDPATFDDRYETALQDLIRARIEGRNLPPRPAPPRDSPVDLLQALRESAKTKQTGESAKAKPTGESAKTKQTGEGAKARKTAKTGPEKTGKPPPRKRKTG